MVPSRRTLPMLFAALVLAGCQPPGAAPGVNGGPLTKLSQFDGAAYTDLAVGPDKTIHALYVEAKPNADVYHVYYRASSDGGTNWSAPLDLTSADPKGRQAGFMRVAIDGNGRVYAIWKALTTSQILAEAASSGFDKGTLVYRVLDQGNWSDEVEVSQPENAYSWYPAVDGHGQLYLVWNEGIIETAPYRDPWVGGTADVFQASVTGSAVGNRQELFRGQPSPSDPTSFDKYDSLRGYVDDAGLAHYVARKLAPNSVDAQVIHWDGNQETTLFPTSRYVANDNDYANATPQLLRDTAGQEHLIHWDTKADFPALLDESPGAGAQPVTIFKTDDPKGQLQTFQADQGPGGRMVALVSAQQQLGLDGAPDLYLATFQDGHWSQPTNLTNNAGRASFSSTQTEPVAGSHVAQGTTYQPKFAAAAFDASGHLDIAMVNNAHVVNDIATTSTGAFGFDSDQPDAYFLKF